MHIPCISTYNIQHTHQQSYIIYICTYIIYISLHIMRMKHTSPQSLITIHSLGMTRLALENLGITGGPVLASPGKMLPVTPGVWRLVSWRSERVRWSDIQKLCFQKGLGSFCSGNQWRIKNETASWAWFWDWCALRAKNQTLFSFFCNQHFELWTTNF